LRGDPALGGHFRDGFRPSRHQIRRGQARRSLQLLQSNAFDIMRQMAGACRNGLLITFGRALIPGDLYGLVTPCSGFSSWIGRRISQWLSPPLLLPDVSAENAQRERPGGVIGIYGSRLLPYVAAHVSAARPRNADAINPQRRVRKIQSERRVTRERCTERAWIFAGANVFAAQLRQAQTL
jgi:hypothetical protein